MSLTAISSIAGLAGGLLKGGKEGGSSTPTGHLSLPGEVKDWKEDVLFKDIQDIYNAPRPQLPRGYITAEHMADPFFAPNAAYALQEYVNQQAVPQQAQQQPSGLETSLLHEVLARQFLDDMGPKTTNNYLRSASSKDLQSLGAAIAEGGATVQRTGMQKGAALDKDGKPANKIMEILQKKQRGGLGAYAE